MLDPRGRQLLLTSLRPPEGYRFDCAVGTTYTLDLIALLTTPLAFAMFDWQTDDGRLTADPAAPLADPLALLESLRRCADRIHVFCQVGQIRVPPTHQRLLAYLEQAVIEVRSPAERDGRQFVFHPKLWVIRYTTTAGPVRYRLLCLTRNLTFDCSWDTVLLLDGELTERVNGFSENRPLATFVEALPGLAAPAARVSEQTAADVLQLSRELRLVRWGLPADVDEIRFWPLGIDGKPGWPFGHRIDRLLVVSPFVNEELLDRVGNGVRTRFLVSRPDSLCDLSPASLVAKWGCFTLDDGLEPAVESGSDLDPPSREVLSGLHAKIFVVDSGRGAQVWTGSANATTAAFGGNVEFLVELIGKKSRLGVDATIGDGNEAASLRSLLVPFEPGAVHLPGDKDSAAAERAADATRRALANLPWIARIETTLDGFITVIESALPFIAEDGRTVHCRPAMLPGTVAKMALPDCPIALRFGPHAAESISSFVAFEVVARVGEAEHRIRFALNFPLIGAPPDRRERLLRDLLRDSRTLLRFLLLLLSDDPEQLFSELRELASCFDADVACHSPEWLPLLEHLLRALHRNPDKLDQVHRLIEDLRRTAEGRSILPAELDQIWEPIRRIHDPRGATPGVDGVQR